MRVEPSIDNEDSTLLKWQPFSVSRWRAKNIWYVGTVCQRTGDAAVSRLCDDLRLMLLVQGDQPRYRLVELTANALPTVSVVCWWAYSPLRRT